MRAEVAPSPVKNSPYQRVTVYADNGVIMGTLLAYTDEADQLADLINNARHVCPNCGAEFVHIEACQVAGGAVRASHTWPVREHPGRGHTGYTPALGFLAMGDQP